jgi:hypothetical protein
MGRSLRAARFFSTIVKFSAARCPYARQRTIHQESETMRRFLPIAALALAFFAPALPSVAAPALTVAVDHVARLSVSRPAGSVIVGNPAVADVTVVDPRTVYVSGRNYGISEVVVLDEIGRTVWQGDVVVTAPTQGEVSIYRGSQVTEMACSGLCAPTLRSGKSGAAGASGGSGGSAPSPALPAPHGAPQPSPML